MNVVAMRCLIAALPWFFAAAVHAGIPPAVVLDEPASRATASASAPVEDTASGEEAEEADWDQGDRRHHRRHHHGKDVVEIGGSSRLAPGERGDAVVSIFGSAINEGDAVDVVSILGNTRVTGPVEENAVSVLGNAYVDAKVDGDVVAVLGNVELGPEAEIDGDVVAVLGAVKRDPAAIVHGHVQSVFGGQFGGFDGLRSWIDHALLLGRPLALHRDLAWAWTLALGFLALYACIALLFPAGISRCVRTLESQPGHTLLAAFIALLLAPVLLVLLCITLVGIAAVPFVGAAFLCGYLFGKVVMLAWIGNRVTGQPVTGPLAHPAVAVLAGGAIVLVLYMVPVLGFLVYHLLGLFGFGAVVYTLVLATREHQAARNAGAPLGGAAAAADGATRASSAAGPSASPGTAGASTQGTAGPSAAGAAGDGPDHPLGAVESNGAPAAVGASLAASMPRAGFWIRMGALLLDAILVGFVAGMLHHGFHYHLAVLGLYGAVMWKLRGSTIGGIVFDLKVVRLDGREIDWETAIIRALACFLSLAVAGLGFIWIAIDPANQAWHDKIAGTVVVRVPRAVPSPR